MYVTQKPTTLSGWTHLHSPSVMASTLFVLLASCERPTHSPVASGAEGPAGGAAVRAGWLELLPALRLGASPSDSEPDRDRARASCKGLRRGLWGCTAGSVVTPEPPPRVRRVAFVRAGGATPEARIRLRIFALIVNENMLSRKPCPCLALALAVLVAADGLVGGGGLLLQLCRKRLPHVQHILAQYRERRDVFVCRLSRRLHRAARFTSEERYSRVGMLPYTARQQCPSCQAGVIHADPGANRLAVQSFDFN